jgi:hypothetical protein
MSQEHSKQREEQKAKVYSFFSLIIRKGTEICLLKSRLKKGDLDKFIVSEVYTGLE